MSSTSTPQEIEGRHVKGSYLEKRSFFLNLDERRQVLLREIRDANPHAWNIVRAYFGFDGVKLRTMKETAAEFGLNTATVGRIVGMVLYYLESPFQVHAPAIRQANTLKFGACRRSRDAINKKKRLNYLAKRAFLLSLDESRKALRRKVIAADPIAWNIVRSYFGLDGFPPQTMEEMATQFEMSVATIGRIVDMVLYYLGSPFPVNELVKRRVKTLRLKVRNQAWDARNEEERMSDLASLGLSDADLPEGITRQVYRSYSRVLVLWRANRLEKGRLTEQERSVLIMRYGLESGKFCGFASTGEECGMTAQQVGKIVRRALDKI